MPTAARFIAALIFALLGYIVAGYMKPLLPEGQPTPYLYPVSTLVPAICAWKVVGRLIGRGWTNAVNTGIYGMAVALFPAYSGRHPGWWRRDRGHRGMG